MGSNCREQLEVGIQSHPQDQILQLHVIYHTLCLRHSPQRTWCCIQWFLCGTWDARGTVCRREGIERGTGWGQNMVKVHWYVHNDRLTYAGDRWDAEMPLICREFEHQEHLDHAHIHLTWLQSPRKKPVTGSSCRHPIHAMFATSSANKDDSDGDVEHALEASGLKRWSQPEFVTGSSQHPKQNTSPSSSSSSNSTTSSDNDMSPTPKATRTRRPLQTRFIIATELRIEQNKAARDIRAARQAENKEVNGEEAVNELSSDGDM